METELFDNRKRAHEWLLEQGYKISQGKFYTDCKDNGFPVIRQDGSVSKFQVLTYGTNLRPETNTDPSALNRSEWAHKKEKADAEIAQMKADRMRKEEDKLWLYADDAWAMVAGLVGNLRDSVRHHLYVAQGEIVMAAGGEQSRSQELFEFVDECVGKGFNEVAARAVHIKFEKESV